jgi:hypothetical protein
MSELSSTETERRRRELVDLYRRAFDVYGGQALWNLRQVDDPTPEQAVLVARQLRVNGDLGARRLAEQIEKVAGSDLQSAD